MYIHLSIPTHRNLFIYIFPSKFFNLPTNIYLPTPINKHLSTIYQCLSINTDLPMSINQHQSTNVYQSTPIYLRLSTYIYPHTALCPHTCMHSPQYLHITHTLGSPRSASQRNSESVVMTCRARRGVGVVVVQRRGGCLLLGREGATCAREKGWRESAGGLLLQLKRD